jgi:hypothetical protein
MGVCTRVCSTWHQLQMFIVQLQVSELHVRRCTRGRPEDPNMQCEPQTTSLEARAHVPAGVFDGSTSTPVAGAPPIFFSIVFMANRVGACAQRPACPDAHVPSSSRH